MGRVEGLTTFLSGAEAAAAFHGSVEVCLAELKLGLPIQLLLCFRNKPNLEVRNDE